MISRRQLKKELTNEIKKEERKRLETFMEILNEIITSERTFFEKPERIKNIIKREVSQKMEKLKTRKLSPEEGRFISHLALVISKRDRKRDEKAFDKICHRLRNRLTNLGGFSFRINKLTKNIIKLSKISSSIEKDSVALLGEVKLTEKEMRNKRNEVKNKAKPKTEKEEQ